MLILPELAVALRRELQESFRHDESEIILQSTWAKARPPRVQDYVHALHAALDRPLEVVLWQHGEWSAATAARDRIGGELTTAADMETVGQLWLFESISLPVPVKQRFTLPAESRLLGRVLLPLAATQDSQAGTGHGYLFHTAPSERHPEGLPFLRLLPELHPSEFIADPHINFIAANRYARQHRRPVRLPSPALFTLGPEPL